MAEGSWIRRNGVEIAGSICYAMAAGLVIPALINWPPIAPVLGLGAAFAMMATVVVVEPLREAAGEHLVVDVPGLTTEVGSPDETAGSSQAGEVAPGEDPSEETQERFEEIDQQVREQLAGFVEDVYDQQGADEVWNLATKAIEEGNIERARLIVDVGLQVASDHTKLLVTASYLSWWDQDYEDAISRAQEAVEVGRAQEEPGEYHYVALSNLAYFLAEAGHSKSRALEAGQIAADHADDFENRDSFVINFGYAQLQFADTREEVLGAIDHFRRCFERDLTSTERQEVAGYLDEAVDELQGYE